MHMGLAGKLMLVELTPGGGAQVRNPDNSPVSMPVLPSEAGIYSAEDGTFYTYPEPVPAQVHRSPRRAAAGVQPSAAMAAFRATLDGRVAALGFPGRGGPQADLAAAPARPAAARQTTLTAGGPASRQGAARST